MLKNALMDATQVLIWIKWVDWDEMMIRRFYCQMTLTIEMHGFIVYILCVSHIVTHVLIQ